METRHAIPASSPRELPVRRFSCLNKPDLTISAIPTTLSRHLPGAEEGNLVRVQPMGAYDGTNSYIQMHPVRALLVGIRGRKSYTRPYTR